MWRWALVSVMLLPVAGHAQSAPNAVSSPTTILYLDVPAGTPVQFSTVEELSSRRQVKGDHIALKTVGDTLVNGQILIPANSAAVGEISDSRGTGGLGVSGKLCISPLYMSLRGTTVRLTGVQTANHGTGADTVIATAIFSAFISGKTAVVPAETRIEGYVLHTVSLPVVTP